jgi:osmotically-inducible protein OsmY
METIRNYVHKTHGAIGTATLVIPDGPWTLNGTVLPESSVEHFARFALQSLQDSYASAKNEAEAVAFYNTKLDKLLAGTLGSRGGEGADAFTIVARSVTRAAMKASFGKDSDDWKAFNDLSNKDQLAKLDANYAANESVLKEAVETELARREAAKASKAKLAKKATFNL